MTEHSRTKVRHPQTNGATEKLNQTIKNEFYNVIFRKKLYTSIEEMQLDLDDFMKDYNFERTNQGKRCQGQTPYETFTKGGLDFIRKWFIVNQIKMKRATPNGP